MTKVWNVRKYDEDVVKEYCNKFNISKTLAKLLIARAVKIDDVDKYIHTTLDDLYDPFLMKDMDKLVDRVLLAKENNEKVIIYGDYDVDGVTSITILYSFLKELGMDIHYYLPDRMEEGYGLNKEALKNIKDEGYALVLTVDCGISAIDEIEYANSIGLEICLTDHHECGLVLPNAYAVVNPKRQDCTYPFDMLAGVGVAFKVITALSIKLGLEKESYLKYLDIVTIGTIADIVPLQDENRIITKIGIDKVRNTSNEGLKALIRVAGIRTVDSTSISFAMAPRINASGRMADASVAVELLLETSPVRANSLAELLDSQNKERQSVEKKILDEVINKIEKEKLYEKNSLVISGKGWHQGVIGIVASKIAEKYIKPVILITYEDNMAKGSGRTPHGISLYDALDKCRDVLVQFGGHELAAGITLEKERISEFASRFEKAVCEVQEKELQDIIDIDLEITKEDILKGLINVNEVLLPFGQKNLEPVYIYRNIKINSLCTLKEDKHLKLNLKDNNFYINAIGFSLGHRRDELKLGDRIDIVGTINVNEFNGNKYIQILLKDFKKVIDSK